MAVLVPLNSIRLNGVGMALISDLTGAFDRYRAFLEAVLTGIS